VIAPSGTPVTLDGAIIPPTTFEVIGGSTFSVARVELPVGTEVHTIHAGKPFGILVYGYGRYTSYLYAGGLDLTPITPPPIY
jgi:hypothetical protein